MDSAYRTVLDMDSTETPVYTVTVGKSWLVSTFQFGSARMRRILLVTCDRPPSAPSLALKTPTVFQTIEKQGHRSFAEFLISPFIFINIPAWLCPEFCNSLILNGIAALFSYIYKGLWRGAGPPPIPLSRRSALLALG
jgi:hypothetical protein